MRLSESTLLRAVHELASELYPGGQVRAVRALTPDAEDDTSATHKGIGYGAPLRITVVDAEDAPHHLVLHTATSDDFGHDRRADRAAEMLLGFDTFGLIPRHTRAIDVGAISDTGNLVSLRHCGEFYLLTEYADGTLYADHLRRIATTGRADDDDVMRARVLGEYLASLHLRVDAPAARYTRAIRDLVGSGEGIFGIIDGYPAGVLSAPPARLRAIETKCAQWRWRRRADRSRLSRIHGDFHPFNILFRGNDLALLDASRGCLGEPADDITCLTINYVFFALDVPSSWACGLGPLFHTAWHSYRAATDDDELLSMAPPYLAWRALVLCNPQWYPAMTGHTRDTLLGLAERCLDAGRLDLSFAEQLFS